MVLESDSIENEKIHKQNRRNKYIWDFFIPKLDSLSNRIYRIPFYMKSFNGIFLKTESFNIQGQFSLVKMIDDFSKPTDET